MSRVVMTVSGICCPSEVPIIQNSLKGLPGVAKISVNVPAKTTTVEYDSELISSDQFVAALNAAHLGAKIRGSVNKSKLSRTVLTVDGICCPSEVPIIQNSLKGLPGVSEVSVNVPAKTTTVEYDATKTEPQDFVDALNRAHLGAAIRSNEAPQNDSSVWKQLPHWNILLAMAMLITAIPSVSENENLEFMKYFALVSIALAWPPIGRKAFGALRVWVLDINCLMTIATVGAIVIEEYLEGAGLVTLFALSEWLERIVTDRARKAMTNMIALKPEKAQLLNGDVVPVEDVQIGAILAIKPGEKVPVDGIVRKGISSVDESSLTGEAAPVSKKEGDSVCSGTINQNGYLEVEATATADDSTVARLVQLVEDAQNQRSPTEKVVEAFAKIYTPTVIAIAILMALLPWAITRDSDVAHKWFYQSLVLLVAACPCALVISTPLCYVCGITFAAQKGILIKGGVHMETVGRLGCLALDKTGTLTLGNFKLVEFDLVGTAPIDKKVAMQLIVNVESLSQHPLANALVTSAACDGIVPEQDLVSDFEIIAGEGLTARVQGHGIIHIGNDRIQRRCCKDNELTPDSAKAFKLAASKLKQWQHAGGTVGWLFIDGVPTAIFSMADVVREEAGKAVGELTKLGVDTIMLTGDNEETAKAVQTKTGLSRVKAQLLPADKIDNITRLREEYGDFESSGWCWGQSTVRGDAGDLESGTPPRFKKGANSKNKKVGMVGDGINDTPALAAASVGFAMGAAGSPQAMETADIVLMDSNLLKLPVAVKIGRLVLSKIRQNVILSMTIKVFILVLVVLDLATLWLAIITDVGSMLIVALNSVSILNDTKATAGLQQPATQQRKFNGQTKGPEHATIDIPVVASSTV